MWAMDAAKELEYVGALATEREQASTSSAAYVTAVEQQIEQSKRHWSLVSPLSLLDSSSTDDEVAADNLAAFEELQRHPSWWPFFHTFGYDTKEAHSSGTMEVGDKFAEGGQAEIFHAKITWKDPKVNKINVKEGNVWVLKVFKKGSLLRDLQKQWPHGYLHWWAHEFVECGKSGNPGMQFTGDVTYGTLLRDGRFGFLMRKDDMDLRSLIDTNMLEVGHGIGPFPNEKVEEIMYRIVESMNWLHERGIIHRDLKASNVLVTLAHPWHWCYVADFECSVGVIGTGFFRAPEILQACKDKTISTREDLFTEASDVYSYGMTYYEVLTGKLPFQDHPLSDNRALLTDLVISGLRPEIPKFVKDWAIKLLRMCWECSPEARPSIKEIMSILEANSNSEAVKVLAKQKMEVGRV